MRIRRQPQPPSATQVSRAENSSNGSLSSSAVAEPKTSPVPERDIENVLHASIEDLSMIYSASKFRASVNWLDRLRVAKGFPVDHNLGVDEVLSSRACSPEETQRCRLEQDGPPCPEQESNIGVDTAGGTDNRRCRIPESSSCGTSVSDIRHAKAAPKSLSCSNGATEVESLHSHTLVEHPSMPLQDVSCDHGVTQVNTPCSQSLEHPPSLLVIATGNNTARRSAVSRDKCSRSTVIQRSSCQDGGIETALSQLYFNMFADLFCMESCGTNSLIQADAKRRQRKQEKPKVCSTFADLDPPSAAGPSMQLQTCEFDTYPTDAIASVNPTGESEVAAQPKTDVPSSSPEVQGAEPTLSQLKKAPNNVSTAELKKKRNVDLDGVSKNDLFIIDTSLPGWRTEKLIFRKGNGWRIRSKGTILPVKGASTDSVLKDTKKQVKVSLSSSSKVEATKEQKQRESDTCIEKTQKVDVNHEQVPNADHVARIWNIAPHTHIRSSRKRRKTTLATEPSNAISESAYTDPEPVKKSRGFAPDHPANQPKEGLVYSIYQVFMQAGKSGLTPREAVSRILEQGLPGLHEGGVVPRVEVLKIVSNSPYFMPLEESKYILCSALVGDEDPKVDSKQDRQNGEQKDSENGFNCVDNGKPSKQHGMSQYWAACAAIRRARTGTTRRKPSLESYFLNTSTHETQEEIAYLANKKRLKSVKQDVTGLGNPCNRSDGKGWHCPLRAKVGYLLCDHHLDRLRTRVKSHIKSKMLSITKSKEERKRVITGSWVVKKVVERSRTGRPSQVSLGTDVQDNFPVHTAPGLSGSKFSQI
ncbi:hypothetical protein GOP47_0023575 [Adiantum capillus-veneris]|uniref:WRC domain-containing protein n=1 Tax=Adiantum capillus-veneris TaxID=13818 RepID=A0A9D4U486_ADICA|nr:hypothetical protein GOP47_0023575 [Adiantum capillus-veneris]